MADSILEEYGRILSGADEKTKDILSYITACLDPNTPSHTISIMSFIVKKLMFSRQMDPGNKERFDELGEQVETILRERGYREGIFTYQEHQILGSTVLGKYAEQPHKPMGVFDGELTVEEANKARQLAKTNRAFGKYFSISKSLVQVSLEPLDENGNTVRDPQVLDDRLEPVPTQYSANFPFRRA